MSKEIEISVQDMKHIAISWYIYFLTKWKQFILIGLLFGILGLMYAWLENPVYKAALTFTKDNEGSGNMSAYSGIAAQFGLDLGGSSASAFEGENLMHLMSSHKLIQKTLFTSVNINNQNLLLINYYAKVSGLSKSLDDDSEHKITFTNDNHSYDRQRDSIIKKIITGISTSLSIERIDKRSDIISVEFKDGDEVFAKTFVEELVKNVIQYYTEYKIKKSVQNVVILQHLTDSVRALIYGNIRDIAVSNDLNVNPTREIVRTSIQRKQVDAQVNGALYSELVKNLELSKLALRRETPLIQVIDAPILPLEKIKMGRLKGALIFGVIGGFLVLIFYISKRILADADTESNALNKYSKRKVGNAEV